LASYSSLSVRKLRDLLEDSGHPLPHYRVGGKILVRRSEFDGWICAFRQRGREDLNAIVREALKGL
jgi:excisionase family DNA binding protein